jgi:hypothetical protein
MYGMHINEEIEWFVNMYIFCDVSLLSNPLHNNIDMHLFVRINHIGMYFFPPKN